MQSPRNSNRNAGFTLLELLLAIAISVIISAGAYKILAATSDAILKVTNRQSKLQALQNLQWSLRHDLHSIVQSAEAGARPGLPRIQLDSDTTVGLRIPGPGATSFLHFSLSDTEYVTGSTGGSPDKFYRSPRDTDLGSTRKTDQMDFDRITLVKTVITDTSGNDYFDWPDTLGNRSAQSPSANHEKRHLPYSLNMTVIEKHLGQIIFEVGI